MLCDQVAPYLSTSVSILPHGVQRENGLKKYAWPVDDQSTEGKNQELSQLYRLLTQFSRVGDFILQLFPRNQKAWLELQMVKNSFSL